MGVFPDDLKTSKVIPTYKADDSDDISNYRPILLRRWFSKIIEHLMYNRHYKYLKENNILCEKEFSFQTGYSTNDAN